MEKILCEVCKNEFEGKENDEDDKVCDNCIIDLDVEFPENVVGEKGIDN